MEKKFSYNSIKDAVEYGFDEYINQECLTPIQTSVKIIEENCRELNHNIFTSACYFINIAIESIKLGEVADFIYDRIDEYINVSTSGETCTDEILQLENDKNLCKRLMNSENYKVIETPFSTKSRIDYLLKYIN